ncbi:CAAD domain-containing protein [Lyngbya confervoides]|uniref:CAAD domain-containing protein n=1 Tax=Lyngbya confervoides BDU141951 TaxID=1574623 RepID=A0ABD4T437_9CYAN|nr:CAAD domain-containing protein [Lyngbya confervoides]MCM1983439.1 CAAD domain-containing protein [Lyngbya confervoides BDU141951]
MSHNGEAQATPSTEVQEREDTKPVDFSTEQPGALFQAPSTERELLPPEVKETADKLLKFLVLFPDYLTEAFGDYRKPMTTAGLVLVAGLTIAVADGVLDRLNTIPLFAPIFELIGLGFSGWFIFRYLLYADSRQELKGEYEQIKGRIVGHLNPSDAE